MITILLDGIAKLVFGLRVEANLTGRYSFRRPTLSRLTCRARCRLEKTSWPPSARYLVVGVYTFPVTKQGQPIITPWKEEEEIDRELPGADEALPGGDAELPGPDAELPGVEEEVPDVLPEEDEPEWQMAPEQQRRSKSIQDTWDRMVEQERDVAAQSLTFVEVVSDRTVPKVLDAIARIYSRLRRWGCPGCTAIKPRSWWPTKLTDGPQTVA